MGWGVSVAACCLLLSGALWSCSSDDDEASAPAPGPEPQTSHSTFVSAGMPNWFVDWTYTDPMPDWQEPLSYDYECSMYLLVTLTDELRYFSTDQDRMAFFINGTCRSVSERNLYAGDEVVFLVHVKGSSEEADAPMEIRYYSGGAQQLFISNAAPPFTPNNILDQAFVTGLNAAGHGAKYPYSTDLTVILPDELPFTISADDKMAIFVGDECRGVCEYAPEYYPGWKGTVYQRQTDEQAQVRYYSAEKGGIYIFSEPFTPNGTMQRLEVTF